mmetsp:Transcript_107812/g.310510  ORF Transcript_107812/g.310510 Transcript_107812/m.310510 type:complete len:443 (+) Transcript_107812:67-1395(+)
MVRPSVFSNGSLSPPGSPSSPTSTRTLGGRYRIAECALLGEGSFAKVYEGKDNATGEHVAVKLYTNVDDDALDQFNRTVNVWNKISASAEASRQGEDSNLGKWPRQHSCNHQVIMQEVKTRLGAEACDIGVFTELVACMDIRRCFVQLLDYSRDEDGEPGVERGTGSLWIVQELGMESLEEEIEVRKQRKAPMKAQDLLDLAWSLVCITWGLHMCGFVHMDIKPMNIVKFEENGDSDDEAEARVEWKLIDLDGAMCANDEVKRDSGKYCFTPLFMPPELARMMVEQRAAVKASRLMDVWSVGMCIMSAIFEMPILEPWWEEWGEETGSSVKFFEWLGDYNTEPIVFGDMEKHLRSIDPGLNMVLKHMLRKDPAHRFCSARCLMHPAFKKYRLKLLKVDGALQQWMEARKSDPAIAALGSYFSESPKGEGSLERRRSTACSVM